MNLMTKAYLMSFRLIVTVLGNAIQTIKSLDKIKLITVRGTSFEAVSAEGGSAEIERGKSVIFNLFFHREI